MVTKPSLSISPDRWRWVRRAIIVLSTVAVVACVVVGVRSYWIVDTLSLVRHRVPLKPAPENSGRSAWGETQSAGEVSSARGVVTWRHATLPPWWSINKGIEAGEYTSTTRWTTAPLDAVVDFRSVFKPSYVSLTDWRWPWLGVGLWSRALGSETYREWFFESPHWLIALVAAAPGSLAAWRSWWWYRRSRWGETNRCLFCGYDLSGGAVSAPCPECGQVGQGSPQGIAPGSAGTSDRQRL